MVTDSSSYHGYFGLAPTVTMTTLSLSVLTEEDAFQTEGAGYRIEYEDDLSLPVSQPVITVKLGDTIRVCYLVTMVTQYTLLTRTGFP